MKNETLEALRRYITVVEVTLRTVADLGPGTSFRELTEASDRLTDAIQNEKVGKEDSSAG